MEFAELDEDQRRRLIDVRQGFEAWRAAELELRHSYHSRMYWRHRGNQSYLYCITDRSERSLGPRGDMTEEIKRKHDERRAELKARIARTRRRLVSMARVNRAAGLGRVPRTAAHILRRLDAEGLLGRQLFVIGTHALFAYEAASGVLFDAGLTATNDVDLLWDVRRRLSLALADARAEGVLGLLKQVDRSFEAQRNSFRAVNAEGYYVDLLRPIEKDEPHVASLKLGDADDDLEAAAIAGLEWLIGAPRFEQIVVGADGLPLYMCCIDPRVFALHKFWVAQQDDREPLKRRRDIAQARAVAAVASQYLGLRFSPKELMMLPRRLIEAAPQLLN